MRIDSEDGLKALDDGDEPVAPADELGSGAEPADGESARESGLSAGVWSLEGKRRVLSTIQEAINGTLDKPAHLPDGIFAKFSSRHVQIVLDKVLTGATNKDLAEKYDVTPQTVSYVMTHPYGKRLKAVILGAQADQLDDIAERIRATAEEALEIKIQLMRSSRFDAVRDRIASDILDRAGFGARREAAVDHTHHFMVDKQTGSAIGEALSEANRVATVDYTQYLAKPVGPQGDAGTESTSRPLQSRPEGPGQPESRVNVSQASHVDTPDGPPIRRKLPRSPDQERDWLEADVA